MNPTSRDVFAGRSDWGCDMTDARRWGETLPPASVHCLITSPPYYNLRDYGTKEQIGLESTPEDYVSALVEVFRPLRQALHARGSFWLNLGDSYCTIPHGTKGTTVTDRRRGVEMPGSGECSNRKPLPGVKHKDLLMIPAQVALALRSDGWYLRQSMPWVCRNKMPESASDRPSTACETVFLLTREASYFFDMEAVKRPVTTADSQRTTGTYNTAARYGARNGGNSGLDDLARRMKDGTHDTRNMRSGDLWFDSVGMLLAGHLDDSDDPTVVGLDVTTSQYKGSHFAAFPKALIRPMIQAGTSQKGVCPHCGAPWVRKVDSERVATRTGADTKVTADTSHGNRDPQRHVTRTKTVGWEPGCECRDNTPIPAVVADPFCGSGTTLAVARSLGRRSVGCEISEEYHKLIAKRVGAVDAPRF